MPQAADPDLLPTRPAPVAGFGSLVLTTVISAFALLLFVAQPWWPTIAHWQSKDTTKTVTGYGLVGLMVALWLQALLRRRFGEKHFHALKLSHQWLGVGMLLVFVLHANLVRQGYLGALTAVLLLTALLGAGVAYAQGKGISRGRRWAMAGHIVGASLLTATSLVHLYFAYAYTGG